MSSIVRWGFLGCGRISHDFVAAMKTLANVELYACAAQSLDRAQAFATTHAIPHAYGSYQQLCADANVDIIYVGTQHIVHFDNVQLALKNRKHVVVEKPMMMQASHVAECVALARANQCLLVEAVWTRFFPAMQFVREALGRIGDVRNVHAHMGVAFPAAVKSVWSRAMGGGGLNCIGIYPLTHATLVLGTDPINVTATGGLSDDGVDTYATATFEYSGDRFATIEYTMLANMGAAVKIVGSAGRIDIHDPAYAPTEVTLTLFRGKNENEVVTSVFPKPERRDDANFNYSRSEGLVYEAEAISNAVRNNETEMREYPLHEMLGVATLMDEIRRQVGVVYDSDAQI